MFYIDTSHHCSHFFSMLRSSAFTSQITIMSELSCPSLCSTMRQTTQTIWFRFWAFPVNPVNVSLVIRDMTIFKAIFWPKYWRYGLEVPSDENFVLSQRLWLWHFWWCIFKNGGFNGGFCVSYYIWYRTAFCRIQKAAIKAAILEDTSSEMSQP